MKEKDLDPAFLKQIRLLPCLACGRDPPSQAHHVKRKSQGGDDSAINILPLCGEHHTISPNSWHELGPYEFCLLFPWVNDHLMALGWEWNGKRLLHGYFKD